MRGRERKKKGCYRLEGFKLVATALDAGTHPEYVLFSPQAAAKEEGRQLLARLEAGGIPCYRVAERLWPGLSSTPAPQGVLAVVRCREPELEEFFRPPGLFLVLDGVQDPGNAGTLVRTAAAAGCSGVVALVGTTDLYADKALRAAAGAQFYLPLATGVAAGELLALAARRGVEPVLAVPEGGIPYFRFPWEGSLALVVGNEGRGPRPQLAEGPAQRVTVPMRAGESLNVAAAAAVLLYEAARQRSEAETLYGNPPTR